MKKLFCWQRDSYCRNKHTLGKATPFFAKGRCLRHSLQAWLYKDEESLDLCHQRHASAIKLHVFEELTGKSPDGNFLLWFTFCSQTMTQFCFPIHKKKYVILTPEGKNVVKNVKKSWTCPQDFREHICRRDQWLQSFISSDLTGFKIYNTTTGETNWVCEFCNLTYLP